MRFYPQILLWTYVLLPAICLLLTPTFIIVLARAQQQRARIMANALTARNRAAAALARNQYRRFTPSNFNFNKYSNGFTQNKPFTFRAKRELEMDIPNMDLDIDGHTKGLDTFERRSNWDQQDEALGQLENMWNMNSFGNNQNEEVIRSMHSNQPERAMTEIVGDPYIFNNKKGKDEQKSDYYSGAFSGRNVYDDVLEQGEPLSLIEMENGAQFIEDKSGSTQSSDPLNPEERVANPDPTFKKIKKKLNKKQPSYQNYHNSYYPQYSHGNSYYSPYGRSDNFEAVPPNGFLEAEELTGAIDGNVPHTEETLGNPQPTFKKIKKLKELLDKEDEPHYYPKSYYNSYQPQYSYSNSYSNPYYRSAETGDIPQTYPLEENTGIENSNPSNFEDILGNPQPTFKKIKKLKELLDKKDEPHYYAQSYYNSYQPQYSYSNSYSNPYYRSAETGEMPPNYPIEDNTGIENSNPLISDDRLGTPQPTFKKIKKLKELLDKKDEPHYYTQSYYSSYHPQNSYSNSYSNPYYRSAEIGEIPQNYPIEDNTGIENSHPFNFEDRLGNPQPTFKKIKKLKELLDKKHEPYPYPQNYHNSYYPQYSQPNSYYNPYYRNAEAEDAAQNGPIVEDMNIFNGEQFPQSIEPQLGDADPTFRKKSLKFGTTPHHQNSHSSYSSPHYTPHNREAEAQKILHNVQEHIMIDEMVIPRFAAPEPTFKKKKKKVEHMPHSFYYPQEQNYNYYSPNQYSSSYHNPYVGSTEIEKVDQNQVRDGFNQNDQTIGNGNPLEVGQKSAPSEPHHTHKKIEKNHDEEGNFFYSSNFYERDNENEATGGAANKPDISQQEANPNVQTSLNLEEQAENNQRAVEENKKFTEDNNINSSLTPENVGTSTNIQNGGGDPEAVGCGLEEKIEEKLEKKIKKLLSKDKINEHKMEYPYPPMYPPALDYGGEYQQPGYYRSASETEKIEEKRNQEIKVIDKLVATPNPDTKKEDFADGMPHEEITNLNGKVTNQDTRNQNNERLINIPPKTFVNIDKPISVPVNQLAPNLRPPDYVGNTPNEEQLRTQTNGGPTNMAPQTIQDSRSFLDDKFTDVGSDASPLEVKSAEADSDPGRPHHHKPHKHDDYHHKYHDNHGGHPKWPHHPPGSKHKHRVSGEFAPYEDTDNQQANPIGKPRELNDEPIDIDTPSMENPRSSLNMDTVHDHSEDVGCELDDNLFDPSKSMQAFDPYELYQRAAEGISEENKKLVKTAEKLLHPELQPLTPTTEQPLEPDVAPQNDYVSSEQPQTDLKFPDRTDPSIPLEEKSAEPNSDPRLHSHGLSHTHSHFHSYTHGHSHQKHLDKQHGIQSVYPPQPHHFQLFPHQQGVSSGFAQANAKAGTITHGGLHTSIAHANSKSFGTGFGSNAAIAQSEAQVFNNGGFGQSAASAGSGIQNGGQLNTFSPNSAQTFNNAGFGQSAASAGSIIQNVGQLNAFNQNGVISQSGAQAFNNAGGFGQSAASAGSGIQNGGQLNVFRPSVQSNSQAFNNAGFGQSGASAATVIQNAGQLNAFNQNSGIAQSEAQAFNNAGFGQSGATAGTLVQNGPNFVPNAAIAQSGAQAFSNAGFGQLAASAGSVVQNGGQVNGFSPSGTIAQSGAQAFSNAGLRQSDASTDTLPQNGPNFIPNAPIAQSEAEGFNEGFGQSAAQISAQPRLTGNNGFQNAQGVAFNNDARQFARGLLDTPTVDKQNKEESFVMPHLDEIPVRELFSEMKSDSHRFSRTPQDFQHAFKDLELASNIVDASLNRNSFLDGNRGTDLQEESQESPKSLGFVSDIVDSSLKLGEGHIQNKNVFETNSRPYSNSQSVGDLTVQGITSIADIVGKALRRKRQITNSDSNFFNSANDKHYDRNFDNSKTTSTESTITEENNGKVVRRQGADKEFQVMDEPPDNIIDENSNTNKIAEVRKDLCTTSLCGSTNKNVPLENFETNRRGQDAVSKIIHPDTLNLTPETATIKSWISKLDHEKARVIYVTPISKNEPIENDSRNLHTSKNLSEDNSGISTIAFDRIGLENPKEVLLTNPVTENPKLEIMTKDSIISHTSDLLQAENSQDFEENITDREISRKHTETAMNAPRKDESYKSVTKGNSFLEDQTSSDSGTVVLGSSGNAGNIENDKAALANREKVLSYLLYSNGTRKNVSDLTSDEIQELQFDMINNSREIIASTQQGSKSNTTKGLPIMNIEDSNVKEDNKTEDRDGKEIVDNSTKVKSNITNLNSTETPINPQKESIRKILFNMSGEPFASIEAEMGLLTDEEKEAFFRQEVDLIAEVIKETFKNNKFSGENLNRDNHTSNIKTNDTEKAIEKVVASPNIFQVFGQKRDREEYYREARGNQQKEDVFDDLIDNHKEKVAKIKNIAANEDDDLLMISFIGDSVIQDLEKRWNKTSPVNQINPNHFNETKSGEIEINQDNLFNSTDLIDEVNANLTNSTNKSNKTNESSWKITKREISSARASRAPLTQLINDPTMKLDVEKTFQNLGSIARHTFENPRAPMYHVRNMLGNAKNSVMSAASVPPNNFLIPSKYEIAKIARDNQLNDEKVGAVNQKMLLSRSGFGNTETVDDVEEPKENLNANSFGFGDTIQKIGGIVRQSVQSGKDTITHVNDGVADAKKVLRTSKYAAPRLIVPHSKPKLESRMSNIQVVGTPPSKPKTVLIAPRVLAVQENIVGAAQEHPEDFVGMGRILDAAGFSQPNQPEVELQRIEFEPFNNMNLKPFAMPKKLLRNSATKPKTKENLKKKTHEEDIVLGAQQSITSPDGTHEVVTENLKDFMQRMHDQMKEIVKSQYEERKRQRKERLQKPRSYDKNKKDLLKAKKQPLTTINRFSQMQPPSVLGDTRQLYNARNSYNENVEMTSPPDVMNRFSPVNQNIMKQSRTRLEDNIKSFDVGVPLTAKSYAASYPYQVQYESNTNTDDEKVALFLPDDLMKPFMGQASDTLIKDYMRQNGDEDVFEREHSDSNLNNPLPILEPLLPSSNNNYLALEPHVSKGMAITSKAPSLNPVASKMETHLTADPYSSRLKPDLVRATMPKEVVDKNNPTDTKKIEEETKELVDLLSDPEIADSEIDEPNHNASSDSFDLKEKNDTVAELKLQTNTAYTESPQQITTTKPVDTTKPIISLRDDKIEQNKSESPSENLKEKSSSPIFKKRPLVVEHVPNENDLGYVLGAINPMMFERNFNERLKINDNSSKGTHEKILEEGIVKHENSESTPVDANSGQVLDGNNSQPPEQEDEQHEDLVKTQNQQSNEHEKINEQDLVVVNENLQKNDDPILGNQEANDQREINSQGRTSMKVIGPYKKPFMGYAGKDKMKTFLNQYNSNLSEDNNDVQQEQYTQDKVYKQDDVEPLKYVVFSSLDDNDHNPYDY